MRIAGAWVRRRAIRKAAIAVMLTAFSFAPAQAQLLGHGLPGLPGLPGVSGLADPRLSLSRTEDLGNHGLVGAHQLADLRSARLADFVRAHRDQVETDVKGYPVVRGQVVAISPAPELLERARAAGFEIEDSSRLEGVGLTLVTLRTPAGFSAKAALARLRSIAPEGQFELDHLFEPSGGGASLPEAANAAAGPEGPGSSAGAQPESKAKGKVGMIDTGVAAHPALAHAPVHQRSFASGPVTPRAHGTAVASLLVGRDARFRGADPDAELYVADVYGGGPVGGASVAIARALDWMASNRVPVINISLVGPDDLALRMVVRALARQGYLIVGAAGNDGPAAPPAFPASYAEAVSVTAVDDHGRVLSESGRPSHLDFAAPGANMAAATLSGWAEVRGTSFASPLVSGQLAERLKRPDPAMAARARAELARSGKPLQIGGQRLLLVGLDLRTPPSRIAPRLQPLARAGF